MRKEGTAMYTALEIAKYVIDKCTNENSPISNLQLQKILYYLQKEFLQQGGIAFTDEIEAWQFGPVIPGVYRQYCGFGALPIRMRYSVNIKPEDERKMAPVIERKRKLNPWDMVMDTHSPGKAWDMIYKDGLGDHQVIPRDMIRNKG